LLTSPPGVLLGARYPRVDVRPSIITGSYGYLSVDLMAAAGKPLEPWQGDGMELMLSTRADTKWACYEYAEWVARQNGKGGLGEARVLTGLFVLDEELLLWSAHEYKTAMEAFRRVRTLIRALGKPISETMVDLGDGVLVKISNTNGEEGFERLDTGQRLKFIARSKGSGRGFSGDVNVIDEAFAYTTDQQDALMPTLIARPNAQIVYLSSPPLTGDTGAVMYALKERAESGGDDSLGYRDWGLDGHLDDLAKVDLDDRRLWAQSNPALGLGRVTVETIERMRRSMTANGGAGFAREVLGLWPKRREGGGAIDMAQWAKLLDGLSKRDGFLALGVDISPQRDYAAIGMFGPREDGLGHWQIIDYRPGTNWLVDRIVDLREGLDPVGIGMGRATGASLAVELAKVGITPPEESEQPARGDLLVTSASQMTAATGQALDAIRQGAVRHIGQPELDAAVAGAKTRETGDTVAWSRKDADADISPLVAISIARLTYQSWAHLVDNVEEVEPWAVFV
jgi:phage terminase large subunit-like protein